MYKFSPVTLIEDNYDEDYGAGTVVNTFLICNTCGALVKYQEKHIDWHEAIRLNRVIEWDMRADEEI